MSHNVHPYAHRLVILRDWKSRWFADGQDYRDNLRADVLLREFIEEKLRTKYVSSVEFERNQKVTRIIIRTSRPGVLIGRQGEGAQRLRKEIQSFMLKNKIKAPTDFQVDIVDIPQPEADAAIVASMVMEMLEKRMPFRRVMKQTAEKVMSVSGVKGVRIMLSGRLNGAEMSRREDTKLGSIPLQFLRADVDYAQATARLPYGGIGIKVWVYKGDSLEASK